MLLFTLTAHNVYFYLTWINGYRRKMSPFRHCYITACFVPDRATAPASLLFDSADRLLPVQPGQPL